MDVNEILHNNRSTSGDYHAAAGKAWRIYGEDKLLHTPLVYGAFEFRLAIERYIFELYYFMVEDGIITDESRNKNELLEISKFSSIIAIIHENAGNKLKLYRALLFNSAFAKIFTPINKSLSVPDIGKFHGFWSKLSEYCHRQLRPSNTWGSEDWIKRGYTLLNKVENYLIKISVEEVYGWVDKSSLVQELQELREDFINKNYSLKSLEIRMNIIKPVLEQRTSMKPKGIFIEQKTEF